VAITPTPDASTSTLPSRKQMRTWVRKQLGRDWLKVSLAGLWLSFLAAHVALDSLPVQLLDRRLQTIFFDIRGPVATPDDIVILAIDDESLSQAEHYRADPDAYPDLALLSQDPWPREVYAIAIDRLMAAGAKVVALDLLFQNPSSYGPADDDALAAALERYGDQVVLASTYSDDNWRQGSFIQPKLPLSRFLDTAVQTGTINFPVEPDGRIHRQGRAYLDALQRQMAALEMAGDIESTLPTTLSFAEATLKAADIDYPKPPGEFLYFYGPTRSFQRVPFWYILDADPWTNQLQSGRFFEDKIVLIGATAQIHQDFHRAPFSETFFYPEKMAGVEILATDIATLRAGNAFQRGLYMPWMRAVMVLTTGGAFGILLWRVNRPVARLGWTFATAGAWFWLSYGAFALAGYVLPTGAPMIGFVVIGGAYIIADIVNAQIRKQRLRKTLEQYVTSPIVQEIISQQDDFKDLLKLREAEVLGLVLGNRYRIVRLLGSGGFGETYVAQDTQRPGSPTCVVKQLRIMSNDPQAHRLGRRFFIGEAETLEKLGSHDQIPRLLAYFEAHNSFYLVEEMIEGHLLKEEFATRQPMPQIYVLELIKGLLPVIGFVHKQGVIHRDIKPSNVIRRRSDGRLVLIDFGAVKLISNKLADTEANLTSTVGVGTQGYMPSEQAAGLPKYCSDLYALGIIAIEALIGMPAYALKHDDSGEIPWQESAPDIDPDFARIVSKMVLYDFTERYQTAEDILADLETVEFDLRSRLRGKEKMPPMVHLSHQTNDLDDDDAEDANQSTQMLPSDWFDSPETKS
jgi:CHASE2 domain-containing sensor protein